MNKVATSINRVSNVLVITILVLTVGFFVFLHYFGAYIPLPTFLVLSRGYKVFLAIASFVALVVLPITKLPNIVGIAVFILLIPLCCLSSYLAIELPKQILDTADLGRNRYYITVEAELFKPRTIYKTYRCNMAGKECIIIEKSVSAGIENVQLVADEITNELRVFRHENLIYIDGTQPHAILTSEEFDDFMYYVGVYPDYGLSAKQFTYILFKCQTSFRSCQQLPFRYTDTGGSFRLKFDSSTNELKVYQWKLRTTDDVLIYAYGVKPKCYVEQCTIPTQ